MKVSFDEVKEVVEMLPISYYAKRQVPVFAEKRTEFGTSYYNSLTDEIHIDCGIIQKGLENTSETDALEGKEVAVRSMVYHELSHAILTPVENSYGSIEKFIKDCKITHDIFNIFEDERIETILKDFYIGVNFKKLLYDVCGGEIPSPKNTIEKFFNLVRFRCYKGTEWAKRVDEIIEKYKDININSLENDYWKVKDYIREISYLYHDFEKEEKKNPLSDNSEERENIKNSITGANVSKGFDKNNVSEKTTEGQGEGQSNNQGEGQGEGNGEGQGEGNGEGQGEGQGETPENHNGEGHGHGCHGGNGDGGKNLLEPVLDKQYKKTHNDSLTQELNMVISSFNKKNNSGNGCTSYSGVFNPRNVARNDFRYFDKKVASRGNNPFGTFHLNLVIDHSGSFLLLQDSANTLINSLLEVEKKNSNFTFDVILSGDGLTETIKPKCYIRADSGNSLGYYEILEVMGRHKKKNAYVYNIVLHDGGVYAYSGSSNKNAFLAWDNANTTIIDTGDNKRILKELTTARIIYSPYSDLVKTLGSQVADILRTAFR